MSSARAYRLAPTAPRPRGLPSIGLELAAPDGVELEALGAGPQLVRCSERRDGAPIGELEVSVFAAALVIDRDGVLEEKARDLAETSQPAIAIDGVVAITVGGASGFRADAHVRGVNRPALPYVHVFAIAPEGFGVNGGIAITIRSAQPEWPAADTILATLRILGRRGAIANDS